MVFIMIILIHTAALKVHKFKPQILLKKAVATSNGLLIVTVTKYSIN